MKKETIYKKVTKIEKGKYKVDIKGVKCSYLKSCLGNYATRVLIGKVSFLSSTKNQLVDGLFFHLNRK
jgi:hypothetical protein